MKIKSLLLLWLFFGCLYTASAQEEYANLKLIPALPQAGKTFKFSYDPKNTELAGKNDIEALIYVYENQQFEVYDLPLTQSKRIWKGSWPAGATAQGFYLYFKAGDDYDNNQGKGYAFLLHDEQQRPVQGAYGGLGASQAGWVGQMRIERDLDASAANLKKEFSRFPESKRIFMSSYVNVLDNEKQEGTEERILEELDALSRDPDLNAEQMAQLSFLYGRYKENEKAAEMAEKAKELDPKGRMAEQELISSFYEEKDLVKKQALAEEFVLAFPESNRLEWIFSSVANEMIAQEQYEQFNAYLKEHPQAATWSVYNSAAWGLAEAEKELALAHGFAVKGYEIAKKEVDAPTGKKPSWASEKQWREQRLRNQGMVGDTYGYILLLQDRPAEALPLLEEAARLQKSQNVEINERHARALLESGENARAKKAIEQYISAGHSNAKMKEYLRELYITEYGNEAGYEAYARELEAPALEKIEANIRKKLISEPAPSFALEDLNGNTVSLADLKGKTVIVDFWATWCGPCISSFPAMQQAVNKFKDDNEVAFVFINSWENGEDKKKVAGDFIRKREYSFDVLLDTDNKTIGDFKVEGIPTKFVIDKEGNIRYRSVGFGGNDEATVTELSMLIELLR